MVYLQHHQNISTSLQSNFHKSAKSSYILTHRRCLVPLHGLAYATPSLIGLAARKIFLHRIHIVQPEKERSMQWGSDLDAISALLEGFGAEDVIEEVLGTTGAEVPL